MGGRKRKGNFGEKKNGCGYQKASAHLLRVLSEFLKALREGGSSRSSVTPPIIKIEPYWVREMERYRDCEEQSSDRPAADAFLHDNKHIPRCADSRQLKGGDPKMPSSLFPLPPTVWMQVLPAAPCVQLLHRWLESGATDSLTRRVLLLLGEWLTEASTTS